MSTRKQAGCASVFVGLFLSCMGCSWIWKAWRPPWIELPSDAEMVMGYAGCGLVAAGVVAIVSGLIVRAAN